MWSGEVGKYLGINNKHQLGTLPGNILHRKIELIRHVAHGRKDNKTC